MDLSTYLGKTVKQRRRYVDHYLDWLAYRKEAADEADGDNPGREVFTIDMDKVGGIDRARSVIDNEPP